MSLDWLANGYDDRSAIMEVGEAPGTSRNYHAFRTPIGMDFQHVCGTPEEFTDGAAFDPLADVKYDEQGLPLCCGGPALPEFELELEFDAVPVDEPAIVAEDVCSVAPMWTITALDTPQLIEVPPGISYVKYTPAPLAFFRYEFIDSTEPAVQVKLYTGQCLLSFEIETFDPGDVSFFFYASDPSTTTYVMQINNTSGVVAFMNWQLIAP